MQESASAQRVSVYRPSDYSTSTFQAEVVESALNVFRMKVDPVSFDSQRASYSVRSPGLGLVCSSRAFIEADFIVDSSHTMSLLSTGPQVQQYKYAVDRARATPVAINVGADAYAAFPVAKVAFAQGDAFGSCLTSTQLIVNGASLNAVRQNEYQFALDKCWFGSKTMQQRFYGCGGAWSQYDQTAVATGAAFTGAGARQTASQACGWTTDSGVAKRIENVLAQTIAIEQKDNAANDQPIGQHTDRRTIRCRIPVRAAGIFSPVSPFDDVSDSCPYKYAPIALPHMNQIQLNFLMKDMEQCVFRNLGRCDSRIRVQLTGRPTLHMTYLRLGAWNAIPASVALPTYRISVHDATRTEGDDALVKLAGACMRNGQETRVMPTVGQDRAEDGLSGMAPFSETAYRRKAEWNITTAQPPSYLVCLLQKSTDLLNNHSDKAAAADVNIPSTWSAAADAVIAAVAEGATIDRGSIDGQNFSRNQQKCASIQRFTLEVQASVGSYKYSSDKAPYLRDQSRLWEDVCKYTEKDYCNRDIQEWRKHSCAIILGADSWLRGISTIGTAYPLQITCSAEFVNKSEFFDGCVRASVGLAHAGGAKGAAPQSSLRDFIAGKPLLLCIYDKARLSVSPSAAILSSQNLSHSTAMDLISRR